jgi:hypothetical protein
MSFMPFTATSGVDVALAAGLLSDMAGVSVL